MALVDVDTVTRFAVPVPHALPTGNHRLHWAVRARLTRQAREAVAIQARTARIEQGIPPASGRCHLALTLIRGRGQRLLDTDSVYAALKPVVDALVDAGWIAGDSPDLLDYTAEQERDPGGSPRVRVTVTVSDDVAQNGAKCQQMSAISAGAPG